MSDPILSRFLGGTIATGLGRLSVVVIGLVGLMITTRILPPEDLGAFVLIQVIVTFLAELSSLGLHLAVPKYIANRQNEQSKRSLINTVIFFRIITIIVTSLIAMIAAEGLFRLFGSSPLLGLIIYIPILLAIESLGLILSSILQGLFKFGLIGGVNLISSLINLLSILFFVVFLKQGVVGLVYARVISRAVSIIFAFLSARLEIKLEFDYITLRQMLTFGFPLFINYILSFIFMRVDTFIVGALLGPAQVAFYEIARKVPESLEMLYDAFRQVYYPFISQFYDRGEHDRVSRMLNHSTRLISFFSIFGALGAFAFGNEMISLLFSEAYLPSVTAFILLMIGLNLTLLDYTLGYSLVAIGESDKPPIINIVRAAVSFIGYAVLVPRLGIAGAALSALAGSAIANPLDVFFLRRRGLDVRVTGYLKPILIFAACSGLAILLNWNSILQGVIVVLFFLLVSVLLSVVTLEDVTAVTNETKAALSKYLGSQFSEGTGA